MSAKDKGAIGKQSGGILRVLPVQDNGGVADPTSTTWVDLGYIGESAIQDETTVEDFHDETGANVGSEPSVRTVKLSGLIMQTDKDSLDFLKETVRGNFYHVYKYEGVLNGKYQEVYLGICKIKPQVGLASGTKRPPFEITCLKNDYPVVSIALTETMAWSSGATVSSEDQYVYVTDANGSRLYQETTGAPGSLGTSAPTHLTGSAANGDITLAFIGYYVPTETAIAQMADATLMTITANTYYTIQETSV